MIFIEKNDIILCNLHILCYRAMFINILNIRKEIIMAHSKSSKKRVFIGKRNAERNQAIRSRVKTFVKKVLAAVLKMSTKQKQHYKLLTKNWIKL